ncbi:adenylosuccinate lyase [candidate division KSB1 bacterium]|nr:adenylosuccinate lyase [candidate division KSB1 bacterium]NIR70151.1 adenylosuccinate lyase [candidate division KSB1 bacterium]NIS28063.1 adenylosuccinate lyase [candidate division KSB1 bacterium]NIT74932.1 adenylosuccinate lyase [candidate division KSB1 bacterium]NIU28716.1 adenylosuccinate lyase [candidate division KSB1 bacterium]
MIERYTRPEMAKIWSDENKFRTWLKVEILVCEALAELGEIPKGAVQIIKDKADFDIKRILEIEETVNHDVIAFLTNVAENVGPESRHIHLGMTSSDLLDTSLSSLIRQAGQLLLNDLGTLREVLRKRAQEFKNMVCIGRSHGIHAEPTTFGIKMALWFDEVGRGITRLQNAIETISVGKISGAVGTFSHISPWVESYVCAKLDLKPAPVSNQIVQRDRHAEFLTTLAVIAASLEKFATEIRNLQRTEVLEVEEPFRKGQKGSSAMPHKRNPITCERITGLARILRANAMAALENVALWHERDITHSSVERVIIPDSTILFDYILNKFTKVVEDLVVYPENMQRNLEMTKGLVFSQSLLLALIRKGVSREDAYQMVQSRAMETWNSNIAFKDVVESDAEIGKWLSQEDIELCFDINHHLRHVDFIFKRVGV